MNENTKFNRTGETASPGAVKQIGGYRPIAKCGDCGNRVVSVPSRTVPGRWNVVNCFPYRNGQGYWYNGGSLHNCSGGRIVFVKKEKVSK